MTIFTITKHRIAINYRETEWVQGNQLTLFILRIQVDWIVGTGAISILDKDDFNTPYLSSQSILFVFYQLKLSLDSCHLPLNIHAFKLLSVGLNTLHSFLQNTRLFSLVVSGHMHNNASIRDDLRHAFSLRYMP